MDGMKFAQVQQSGAGGILDTHLKSDVIRHTTHKENRLKVKVEGQPWLGSVQKGFLRKWHSVYKWIRPMDALGEPDTGLPVWWSGDPSGHSKYCNKKKSHAVQKAFFPTHHNEGSDTAAVSSMRVT